MNKDTAHDPGFITVVADAILLMTRCKLSCRLINLNMFWVRLTSSLVRA